MPDVLKQNLQITDRLRGTRRFHCHKKRDIKIRNLNFTIRAHSTTWAAHEIAEIILVFRLTQLLLSELSHKPKLGPLHHSKPEEPPPASLIKPENLEIVPRKLYLARPLNLSYPPDHAPPQDSSNLPSSVVVPSLTSSPHLLLDLNKCTKFRITLRDLSSASERIYRIHSLRASRNVRENVWVPAKAVVSEETETGGWYSAYHSVYDG